MKRVRINSLYTFAAVGFDRFDRRAHTPADGEVVRAIKSPHGCPPAGTMGHIYVATPEGQFIGLVQVASLQPIR